MEISEPNEAENIIVQARDISVKRQGKTILNSVSLAVKQGEFITVVGPNGAGKSTLLKALIGIETVDDGEVMLKPDTRIGYVPQRLNVPYTLPISAEHFLKLGRKISSEMLDETVEMVGIAHCLQTPLYSLSGGEMQRVLLARSLLCSPQLLVLDEPAQNLDIGGQLHFYQLLESIYTEKQMSIVMVSHDLHMVMASSQRVICLYHHICCSGAPHMVAKDPEFVSLFGEDMSQMLAVYHHLHDHEHDGKCQAEHQGCEVR